MLDAESEEDDVVDVVGTLFIADEESSLGGALGIDTDDEEIYLAGDDFDDELRDLEGEVVTVRGNLWTDNDGNSWLRPLSVDLGSD